MAGVKQEVFAVTSAYVNAYIVRGQRSIIVDTGAPGYGSRILNAMDRHGIRPEDISLIIITHGHYDHTTGVKAGWKKVLLHPDEFDFKGPYLSIPKNAEKNPMKPMEFGSHALEFFHTPGHTDGSICILDKKTGVLFSGDTAFADGIWGRTDLGGDEKEMEESMRRIAKIPYKLLCPGHGKMEEKE